ncbi:MAG: methyltransferase domain-containing protein [Anaerolineales bacterium]|nr:methyltransferase domain-containing protein [Anaerolineales bacterium]
MTKDPNSEKPKDNWASGDKYEPYVGRWSRLVAREFIEWLEIPKGSQWLDVGCGTGALSQTILQVAEPAKVTGVDRSENFVAYAQAHTKDERAEFEVSDAQALRFESASFDAVVSGLVLNFIPKPELAVAEMTRVAKQSGVVAIYVWDYADGMQFMRHFWDAAEALDPKAVELDEGRRFSICNPEALEQLFKTSGLHNIEVRPIEVPTNFRDFDDYWSPFLGGQGPAPSYLMSLSEEQRTALRERIRADLPFASDGSIPLVARAWAVKGMH